MAIEELAEEVASNLEEAAEATRQINTTVVGYFLGGVAVGAVLGFYWGYRFNREKIRAEAFKESEIEVEKIREVYQQKVVAAEPKPSIEEMIEERGYSVEERPLKPPVPVSAPPVVIYEGGKSKDEGWDYKNELAKRSPDQPYIIHQDEFKQGESGYIQVTYTYYAEDDVLCEEDDRPLPHAAEVVGVDNLRFGHGADDIDVVFVRNERLELEMEICRSPKSYEEEILGLNRNESD